MIIIGHDFIEFKPFYFIKNIEDITNTPSNSTVVFEFNNENISLCNYCYKNEVNFALIADSMEDVIFANALHANYIICDKSAILVAQKFADDYIIDAKILLYSSNDRDMEWVASNSIDGIIYEKGIDYGSC